MSSLLEVHDAWARHPLGKNRTRGGRRALGGFRYQLYLTLERFFDRTLAGDREAQFVFDGLSDVAEARGGLVYLTQVKSTLTREAAREAAKEALAVDAFAAEAMPEARETLRYQLAVRRSPSSQAMAPADLNAGELGLDGADLDRWQDLRHRFLPVTVHSHPEVDLAIKLWPHLESCFAFLDACLGRLLDLLGEDRPSPVIAGELLRHWDAHRAREGPPLSLLGVRSFVAPPTPSHRIVHGARPMPEDLLDGCFMERPHWLEQVLEGLRLAWDEAGKARGRRPVPVFWITGPSGSGKSVLLLQAVRELLARGLADGVNDLREFARRLPQALRYWAAHPQRVVVAVDDVFAPENRDPVLWQEVAETAAMSDWRSLPLVLTCGPTEQLRAFRKETARHSGLELSYLRLPVLDQSERLGYHRWYQERTGAEVRPVAEPIFVAATWIYELAREVGLSSEAFIQRFADRLEELGLTVAARAALAFNSHGLKAPEGLFSSLESSLDRLVSEGVYRLSRPGEGRAGFFFHPRIATLIYDGLVPRTDERRRAEDLARGYQVLMPDLEDGIAFLDWLGNPKSKLARGVLREILEALWPIFDAAGASETTAPQLLRWYRLTEDQGIDRSRIGAIRKIREWWQQTEPAAAPWSLLFQLVWADSTAEQRDVLFQAGCEWLSQFLAEDSWSFVWRLLWAHRPREAELRDLGVRWILANPELRGCGFVWRDLFAHRVRHPRMGEAGLALIIHGPETPAEIPRWKELATLVPRPRFLDAIVRKMARMGYLKTAVPFFLSRLEGESPVAAARSAFEQSMDELSWGRMWQEIQENLAGDREFLKLGRRWLDGRDDRPDWNYVWQRLLEEGHDRDDLLSLGRRWLDGRDDRPEWSYVWRRLLEEGHDRDDLLSLGRRWLDGRDDRPDWAFVWQRLLVEGHDRAELLSLGRRWLDGRDDRPDWNYVWQRLLVEGHDRDELLSLGRRWLDGRQDDPGWPFVWEYLVDYTQRPEKQLLNIAESWLGRHGDHPIAARVAGRLSQ